MTMPPLLALAEGRRVRPRKAVTARPKELDLHIAVVAQLRRHAAPDWTWTHVPAGERRAPRDAAKLKAMGLAAGWPDLSLISPAGVLHSLELKRRGEGLSDEQEAWRLRASRLGWPFAIASTMPEIMVIFREWRCLVDAAIGGDRC